MSKAWGYVALTSFFELVWIFSFNVVNAWWQWIFIITFIIIDFYFLTKACELLPTGTVYAFFAGVGTLGTTLMHIFLFNEIINLVRLIFFIILIFSVILLIISYG